VVTEPSGPAAPPVAGDASAREAETRAAIWRAIGTVVDPEIPIVSIVELGIVRGVERVAAEWVVTITPTYSGCPAARVIEDDVRAAVVAAAGEHPRIVTALAPAWSTDWIAPEARQKLAAYGIAPPHATGTQGSASVAPIAFDRSRNVVRCPNCGSARTVELARFGSTACKAQYRCIDCLEPFDYFKPH
jgi:ring-1,2-phenylacetyl-CoA epoxidase subunit PaaD